MHSASTAVLTFAGGTVIMAGFFGINSAGAGENAGAAQQADWEAQQADVRRQLQRGDEEDEEWEGPGARTHRRELSALAQLAREPPASPLS